MYQFTKNPAPGNMPSTLGKLNLRIAGFSRQHIVSIDQIVRAIDILPCFHLEGLREIVYAPEWLENNTPRSWGNKKGEFRQKERKIIFFDFDHAGLFHQILYHEIGHFVFFLTLNSKVKKQWVTEIFPNSDCITPYGAMNASEDFAESYASYVRNPDALKQLPIKFAFMRDRVFSGKADTLKEKIKDSGTRIHKRE